MKVFVHTIRMRQRIVDSRLVVFLLALSLAHGLIAASLLVECIPADGRSLVELIGQDPCHHPFGAVETESRAHHDETRTGDRGPTDPCVDLIFDSLGVSAGVMEIHVVSASATDRLADASPNVVMVSLSLQTTTPFRWAREPANPREGDSRQLLSLRI